MEQSLYEYQVGVVRACYHKDAGEPCYQNPENYIAWLEQLVVSMSSQEQEISEVGK